MPEAATGQVFSAGKKIRECLPMMSTLASGLIRSATFALPLLKQQGGLAAPVVFRRRTAEAVPD
jgi:hypothetical protein